MRVSEFPFNGWTLTAQIYNPLHEAFVLGLDQTMDVEWVVDDAIAQFGDQRHESKVGERIRVHESGATFLVLKGWAKLV